MIYSRLALGATLVGTVTSKYYSNYELAYQSSPIAGTAIGFWKNRGTQNVVTSGMSGANEITVNYPNSKELLPLGTSFVLNPYPYSPATLTAYFANTIALTRGEEQSDYTMFTNLQLSSPGPAAEIIVSSSIAVYSGEYSSWSAQQVLYPPDKFKENSFFGTGMDYDEDSKVLAVSCPGCNYTTAKDGFSSGAVYLYEQRGPKKELVNTAILTPRDSLTSQNFVSLSAVSPSPSQWGQSIQLSGDTLIWQAVQGLFFPYLVFSKIEGKWRHVQTIAQDTVMADVFPWEGVAQLYDDTIVIGNALPLTAGYVNVFAPSTVDAKGKPQPKQWSLQQKLIPPSTLVTTTFGQVVAINKDTLTVGDGANLLAIYSRPSSEGRWSLQQTLTAAAPIRNMEIVGSTIAAVLQSGNLVYYTENKRWDCLVVSVEDHFGDGWDGAKLRVDVPTGEVDYFYPRCDTENPFQFRYCPSDIDDKGLYKFSIEGASKSRFYWELLWRVYDEGTGDWYTGNWDTKLDFDWDSEETKFQGRKITKPLPNNVTCKNCKFRPTSKPSAQVRALKGGDDKTHHPTISPAPTVATSSNFIWQILTLTGDDNLFVDQHKSTSYYISDSKGRRLISTGTLCPAAQIVGAACWEDLPDGDYIVRLGGALNLDDTGHLSFCKTINPIDIRSQLMIRVENDDCQVISLVTRDAFCTRNLHIYTLTYVELNLLGVTTSKGLTGDALAEMFASTVSGVHSVKIVSMVESSTGLTVTLTLSTEGGDSIDYTDVESVSDYGATIQAAIQNGLLSMRAAAQAGAHMSPLHSLSSIQVVDIHNLGTEEVPDTLSAAPLVTSSAADAQTQRLETGSSQADHSLAIIGLLVGIAGVALVALVTMAPPSPSPPVSASTSSPVAQMENDMELSMPSTSSSSPESMKRKSKVMEVKKLSRGDLNELIESEDAALRILQNMG